jgi:hypothetical protein
VNADKNEYIFVCLEENAVQNYKTTTDKNSLKLWHNSNDCFFTLSGKQRLVCWRIGAVKDN